MCQFVYNTFSYLARQRNFIEKISDVTRIFRLGGGLSLEHDQWRRKRFEAGGEVSMVEVAEPRLEVEVY